MKIGNYPKLTFVSSSSRYRVRSYFSQVARESRDSASARCATLKTFLQVDLSLVGRNLGAYETDVCSLEQDAVVDTLDHHVSKDLGLSQAGAATGEVSS